MRVIATTPLQRAGLERLLQDAGVDHGENATVTVRTTDEQPVGSTIDMSIGPDEIGIQLRSAPTRHEWQLIIQLVGSILGNLDRTQIG